jgi:hypothetical protein
LVLLNKRQTVGVKQTTTRAGIEFSCGQSFEFVLNTPPAITGTAGIRLRKFVALFGTAVTMCAFAPRFRVDAVAAVTLE